MEAKDPRKSSNVEERRKAAEADYYNNQDLSWAKTDPFEKIRSWAVFTDSHRFRNLSQAETDTSLTVKNGQKQLNKK